MDELDEGNISATAENKTNYGRLISANEEVGVKIGVQILQIKLFLIYN